MLRWTGRSRTAPPACRARAGRAPWPTPHPARARPRCRRCCKQTPGSVTVDGPGALLFRAGGPSGSPRRPRSPDAEYHVHGVVIAVEEGLRAQGSRVLVPHCQRIHSLVQQQLHGIVYLVADYGIYSPVCAPYSSKNRYRARSVARQVRWPQDTVELTRRFSSMVHTPHGVFLAPCAATHLGRCRGASPLASRVGKS
jgi:hypothetical protein